MTTQAHWINKPPNRVRLLPCAMCGTDTVHHRVGASDEFSCWCGASQEYRSEPATPDEEMEAEKGREVEWLGLPKLIARVHVTKSFAARWSTNPQDYKDYYHTDNVEIQE